MFMLGLADGPGGFDPLILLLVAMLIEAYIGEARFLFGGRRHPLQAIRGLVAFLDRKLNREHRSQVDRAMRGALMVVVLVVLCGAIGWGVAMLTRINPYGALVEMVLLVTLVGQRGPYNRVRAVAGALSKDGLDAARTLAAPLTRRDLSRLDAHGVARLAVESAAGGFAAGAVAPVFWYVLFGFPGILIFRAVDLMAREVGHPTPRHRAFGFTAARLDWVLSIVPAALSAVFLLLAALVAPTARPARGLRIVLRDAARHPLGVSAWPIAAMAGSLDLALGGPRHYAKQVVKVPWIGDGRARAEVRDIRRALYLMAVACLVNAMWVAAIAIIRWA